MAETPLTYKDAGIDYDAMDPFKLAAQKAAQLTDGNITRLGCRVLPWSRGESAFLVDTGHSIIGHVEEGLGTKNDISDAFENISDILTALDLEQAVHGGRSLYEGPGQCTVAMIVNDLLTLKVMPVSVAMHLAVGSGDWFANERRSEALIRGWRRGCDLAGATWGGGETPTLPPQIFPPASVIAGSAWGITTLPEEQLKPCIKHGDAIYLFGSSGIHANYLSACRKIAANRKKLPKGYLTRMSDGRFYGEALLDPTLIYVPLIEELLRRGIPIHYLINITGHGWRKIMRALGAFRYVIKKLPDLLPIFQFVQEHGPVTDEEAYGNMNMGAGYAAIIPRDYVEAVDEVLATVKFNQRFTGFHGGDVEATSGEREVVIVPKDIVYKGSSLAVR